tara:strand:- start:2521 stop:3498 length:978 start_codon:yes stop_codon:yes gene_type:complete
MVDKSIKQILSHQKKNIKDCNILCIGDIILDHYVDGLINRISPEAPIPILLSKKESYQLGGVGNVSRNIVKLGAKVSLLYISNNTYSSKMIDKLINKEKKIKKLKINIPEYKVPTKTRYTNKLSQVLRVDDEESNHKLNSIYKKEIINKLISQIKKTDLIILSDYNKGLLDKDLIQKIVKISNKYRKKVIADPKKNNLGAFAGCSIITPNQKEILDSVKKSYLSEKNLISVGKKLIKKHKISYVLITRSEKGMLIIGKDTIEKLRANAKKVIDVTGAGDTVIAVLGLMIATGLSIKDSIVISNFAAGRVIGKNGTETIKYKDLAS